MSIFNLRLCTNAIIYILPALFASTLCFKLHPLKVGRSDKFRESSNNILSFSCISLLNPKLNHLKHKEFGYKNSNFHLHVIEIMKSENVKHHHSPFVNDVDMNCEGNNVRQKQLDEEETAITNILIILNRPIPTLYKEEIKSNEKMNESNKSLFEYLWEKSSLRICADGGANRLYRATSQNEQKSNYLPDFIVGDLDSIKDNVRDYYQSNGCSICRDSNQDINDLDKSVQAICDLKMKNEKVITLDKDSLDYTAINLKKCRICIYGAFGGRFDQTMASIQTLYKWIKNPLFSEDEIILYTEETSARFLDVERTHVIHVERSKEGPCCGLIPIGSRCDSVSTEGLQWNLNEDMGPMEFGGLVSTSNLITGNNVKVNCSQPLIWTTEIRGFQNSND